VQRALKGPITIDNPMPYRMQAVQAFDTAGVKVNALVAFPVAAEKEHLQKVGLALAIGVILVSVIGAFLAWLLVRSSLKPVDSMIEVAGDIANGDLERRVPEMKEGTELGDLATSLNAMIAFLQSSLHEREESEMTMRRFLGDASHELRTPLTVIRGYAELLGNEQILDDAQRERAIQRLDTESARMETLVLDLLNLARLDEHRPLMLKPVDMSQLIRDALDDLRIQQPGRDITISAPPVAIVNGDETRLRQIMANLVGNIRSYTPEDSPVAATVTIAADQKWHDEAVDVVVTLDDSGSGIPAEQRELARQRFGRLDSSRARATGGFGLGLSIVDAVVTAHEGTFELAESPTRGLRVIVRLPVDGPEHREDDSDLVRPDASAADQRFDLAKAAPPATQSAAGTVKA
jgi:two-component system OmpR family sensor kinase